MIEFTLSRVALGICGLLILASVVPFFGDIQTERIDNGMEEQAGAIASLLDSFSASGSDSITVCVSEILPSPSSVLRLEGHFVTIEHEGSSYRAVMLSEAAPGGIYDYGDILEMTKREGGIDVRAIA